MTLTQLEYVLAVNKTRHFGKAAQQCHITQPTLSMQIQKLEEELGIVFFDRSRSPVMPTLEGESVIHQIQIAIREQRRILDVIKGSRSVPQGPFRLGVIPTLAPFLVPLFAKPFADHHSKIDLTVDEMKTDDILAALDAETVDAGLMVTPLSRPNLIERVLYYEPFYLYVCDRHPLYKKTKVDEHDLDINDMWLLAKGNCFRDQVLKICGEGVERKTSSNLKYESGNFETLKQMVSRYSGYTLLPHMGVSELRGPERKWVREFSRPVPTREVSIVYSRSFLKERIIEALEKEILGVLPEDLMSLKKKDYEVVPLS